jgi:hypothetical protein
MTGRCGRLPKSFTTARSERLRPNRRWSEQSGRCVTIWRWISACAPVGSTITHSVKFVGANLQLRGRCGARANPGDFRGDRPHEPLTEATASESDLILAVQLFTQELLKTSKLDWHGRGYDVRYWIEHAQAAYVAGRPMPQAPLTLRSGRRPKLAKSDGPKYGLAQEPDPKS